MNANWTIVSPLLMGTLMIAAGFLLTGCSNRSASKHDLELLTTTPWKYEKAGFDSNDDGIFDALDPRIAGSEKDNTIIFCKDGSGTMNSLPFVWAFQNGDSTIYFQDQYYKVRTLDKHRLEIYADEKLGGVNTRYIIILKH